MTQDQLNYQRVAAAIEYLTQHFREQPELQDVAAAVHLSPEHFQRIFTEWAGVSPKRFTQFLTIEYLRAQIRELPSIQEAADAAGLSAQSRVYDLFVNIEGVTPAEFRRQGAGLRIRYGYHRTPFGECFLAAAERGVCALAFVDEVTREAEFSRFSRTWSAAQLEQNQEFTRPLAEQIFAPATTNPSRITLLVQGTNFQIKVWEALLRIPAGAVSTYAHIARSIGSPAAWRAVGSAIGANPVGYLIPCHRVIRSSGQTGDYHWGATRKQALIGWEMAQRV